MYIEISNLGNIDIEAFKLLGASTKTGDNDKIGRFGSGLKYSIAYLLRNKLEFSIYSGLDLIKFELKKVSLRDQEFSKIVVNGSETSITTSWGKNWNKWKIFREVVANGLDEEGFSMKKVPSISPEEGKTKFYLQYADFSKYYSNTGNYFLENFRDVPLVITKEKPSKLVAYKKGIRVVEEDVVNNSKIDLPDSIFNYRLEAVSLDEERIASKWEIDYEVRRALANLEDVNLIKKLLKSLETETETYEHTLLSGDLCGFIPSDQWLEAIESLTCPLVSNATSAYLIANKGIEYFTSFKKIQIPASLYDRLEKTFKTDFKNNINSICNLNSSFEELDITPKQVKKIKEVLRVLVKTGIRLEYPIKVVRFIKDVKEDGIVDQETIIISEEVFNHNPERLLSVIIEQYIKIKYKLSDTNNVDFRKKSLEMFAKILNNKYNTGLWKFF